MLFSLVPTAALGFAPWSRKKNNKPYSHPRSWMRFFLEDSDYSFSSKLAKNLLLLVLAGEQQQRRGGLAAEWDREPQ